MPELTLRERATILAALRPAEAVPGRATKGGRLMHQTEHPCAECPWSRQTTPGLLGGSPPETYVGQILLPFWLPCHQARAYAGKRSDVNAVHQCAGAAIMRAHLGVSVPAPLLTLPPDRTRVFASLAEFVAHHTGQAVALVNAWLTPAHIRALAAREWTDPQVQVQLKRREVPR